MTDGLAIGSPVSPIVANILMEHLERNAILTMKDRPRLWLRFVDNVLAIVKRTSLPSMLEHLNKQNAAITFTMEVEKDGKLYLSFFVLLPSSCFFGYARYASLDT